MKHPLGTLGPLLLVCLASCSGTGFQAERQVTMSPQIKETNSAQGQALLVLDMQNDFCRTDGKMHGLVAGELAQTGVIDATVRLVHAAKERNVPTFVTPIHFDYSKPQAGAPEGIAAPILANGAFDREGEGGKLIDEIAELVDGRSVIRLPKPSLSAFAETGLDQRLRELGVQEVVISGLVTNYCVESTARDAFDLGYRVRVVGDATAGFDAGQREFAMETIFPMLGRVISVDDFAAGRAGQ